MSEIIPTNDPDIWIEKTIKEKKLSIKALKLERANLNTILSSAKSLKKLLKDGDVKSVKQAVNDKVGEMNEIILDAQEQKNRVNEKIEVLK